MTPLQKHEALTAIRRAAFDELFDDEPETVYPAHELRNGDDDPFLIDVFVYEFEMDGNDYVIQTGVTNGLSDLAMPEGDDPDSPRRRELIWYTYDFTTAHAKLLRDMAWLPLHDLFHLDSHHTIPWQFPAVEGSPWKNAFFLVPLLRPHREFTLTVDGDETSFLWYIPISDAEREYKVANGADALIDLMQEAELPWIFDEESRQSLV
jgi:Suppressor of fused protein (SUFU)